jgi:steroid delta-isomerase-like uncharacterized protein
MGVAVETSNKALFHHWFGEVWNKGNYPVAFEVVDKEFLVHGAGGQVVKQGPEGVIGLVKTWREAFPDGQMTIDGLIAEGELVAALLTWHGTQEGTFYGIPASGKHVEVTSIGIDRIVGGKIVAGWGEVDMLGMMQQLGALPQIEGSVLAGTSLLQYAWGLSSTSFEKAVLSPTLTENHDLLLRFNQSLHEGREDVSAVDNTRYVEHNPTFGWGTLNFAQTLQFIALLRQALPDMRSVPDEGLAVSEGELVAQRWLYTGTHTGSSLFGIAPTGKQLDWSGIDLARIIDGKLVERWFCVDALRLVQQLGVLPAAG